MSYQISTKATNVVVGDRVNKDRRFHSVVDINVEQAEDGGTVISLVFGNQSTIPLRVDDYITVKRSSTATTPKQERTFVNAVDGHPCPDAEDAPEDESDEFEQDDEDDDLSDYGPAWLDEIEDEADEDAA